MTDTRVLEERLNAFTHSAGFGLAAAALAVMTALSVQSGSALQLTAFLIYGISQVLLYLSSALTHLFSDMPKAHYRLRVFDQVSVYLLIAGTYTPITLLAMREHGGLVLFAIEWALALLGIVSKLFIFREKNIVSDLFYIPMGWLILFFLPTALDVFPRSLLVSVFTGGFLYTFGVIFYVTRKVPFSHVIWHLFVIAGSVSFFAGYLGSLL